MSPTNKLASAHNRRARLDYLALPAKEGDNDLRLLVRELTMSILYEQAMRCVKGD